jgi:hypothetical protein
MRSELDGRCHVKIKRALDVRALTKEISALKNAIEWRNEDYGKASTRNDAMKMHRLGAEIAKKKAELAVAEEKLKGLQEAQRAEAARKTGGTAR